MRIPRQGEIFTEAELYSEFKVRNMGGIRPSNQNKVIILIDSIIDYKGNASSNPNGYRDTQDDDVGFLTYVGEGQDDQSLTRNNKNILLSKENGYTMLYFKKIDRNKLIFRFPVSYDSHSSATQENRNGYPRKVILFKLRILD